MWNTDTLLIKYLLYHDCMYCTCASQVLLYFSLTSITGFVINDVVVDPVDNFTDEAITAKHTNGQQMERPLQVLMPIQA